MTLWRTNYDKQFQGEITTCKCASLHKMKRTITHNAVIAPLGESFMTALYVSFCETKRNAKVHIWVCEIKFLEVCQGICLSLWNEFTCCYVIVCFIFWNETETHNAPLVVGMTNSHSNNKSVWNEFTCCYVTLPRVNSFHTLRYIPVTHSDIYPNSHWNNKGVWHEFTSCYVTFPSDASLREIQVSSPESVLFTSFFSFCPF